MSKLFFSIICLGILFSSSLVVADDLPASCRQDCEVTYGHVLGQSKTGVEAYSNCNNQCVNPAPYFIDKTFTGIKWQCVEYARRWLLVNQGVIYGDVDVAADIWNLEQVSTPDKKSHKPFMSILNGSKLHKVQRGDLLIYSRDFLGTGHVAVVLNVDSDRQRVYLGEQTEEFKYID